MRSILRLAPILALGLVLSLPAPAFAMRFVYQPDGATGGFVVATGVVSLGDDERMRAVLHSLPPNTRLEGLSLNSPGGDLEEGLRLATSVHDAHVPTVVGPGAICASACFLVFAAGSPMFASTSALVGVHSASYRGTESADAQLATLRMVRRLSEFNVPDAILGKLVTAHPSQIWWLTRAELESMRVDMTVPQMPAAPVQVEEPADKPAVALATPDVPAAAKASQVKVAPVKPGPVKTDAANSQAAKWGFRIEPPANGFHVW
ncbi:hypothetical protein [Acidisphaera sp. L21]|uniref:COG3904 family protein n=1 Tax=Acidisphaera sp. L21 TaxID=1641851 RepID=UPI00131DF1EF|nr:hypothetical protein [Acidisphaera sp. L21]